MQGDLFHSIGALAALRYPVASRCCSTVNQKTVVHRENPPILLFHGILLMWKYHPAAALRRIHTDLLGRRNSLQVTVAYFPWSSVVCQSSSDRSLVALTHLSPLCAKKMSGLLVEFSDGLKTLSAGGRLGRRISELKPERAG